MKRSSGRILTTHTGSLPRPDDLAQMVFDRAQDEPFDETIFLGRAREAVNEAVQKQVEAGIDVVSDGEQSKIGFVNYVQDRMTGFGGERQQFRPGDLVEYPEVSAMRTPVSARTQLPACTSAVAYTGYELVQRDIETLKAALQDVKVEDAFIPATSPGTVAQVTGNVFHKTREEFVYAVADALHEEYRAIVESGINLQVDACDLAMEGHISFYNKPLEDFRKYLEVQVGAINHATRGLAQDKIRLHLCWGNYPGPHHRDRELKDFIDLVLKVRCGAISFEASNPRHGHEWKVWQSVDLPPDVILIPGVIDTCTNYIEHPELVAERIGRFASIVGPERVIAGTDCGFGTFVGQSAVFPRLAYAKLATLAEGARLASSQLFRQALRR